MEKKKIEKERDREEGRERNEKKASGSLSHIVMLLLMMYQILFTEMCLFISSNTISSEIINTGDSIKTLQHFLLIFHYYGKIKQIVNLPLYLFI